MSLNRRLALDSASLRQSAGQSAGFAADDRHGEIAIKPLCNGVFLAHLQIDEGRAAFAEGVKRREHQRAADAAAPDARMHGEIFDEIARPALSKTADTFAIGSKKEECGIEFRVPG